MAIYKENVKEIADLILDQEMTGLEKAVWWTEYVLRHRGTDHFRDPSVDLPLYQYYLLDVICFVLTALLFTIYILYKTITLLWKTIKWLFKIGVRKKIKTS
ncbi:hypothetical protein NQ314_016372 [Rhamnusium bicolor]|uniref:Uncharacterized protein n=1 Tax=Rhamnusium bicolor TaxID=1586634 RepID=A0AAV8WX33_9CUCU|nr:hypothetical protein NQ314_016372 [Rhamnusium bicolor]